MEKFDHAIVIGAGMAGLSSAAVLSAYFNKVTVLDKDCLLPPDEGFPKGVRKAVPQGGHIHILLRAGLDVLESVYPGISQTLEARGSVRIQLGVDQQIFEFGEWMPERDLDVYFLSQSRPLLERAVLEYTDAIDNVDIRDRSAVSSLLLPDVHPVSEPTVILADGEQLTASLIVDAAGNAGPFISRLNAQLAEAVQVDTFPTNIFYSTVHFEKNAKWRGMQENILIIPEPGVGDIGGSLISVEHESWCVSLHGRNGAPPPRTMSEWMEAARSLPDDRIWQRIRDARPVSEVRVFKKPTSTFRRFDLNDQLPAGYVPVGDTITSFNPIYGQGMSVALGHVRVLQEQLDQYDDFSGFRSRYLQSACEWSRQAWQRAVSFDTNYRLVEGQEARIGVMRKLTLAQHAKAKADPEFHLKLARQAQMLL
ncbi:FAD-dependent oxidoreductase [Gynuella sp.]|uniref:FAD-dependent oxidoreductase n=1 Tax=Gynuella sp. TaxID=2969146 RepID=UPI003D098893